ncbi:hypothetical protein GCM10023238_29560 [Streptomyces heliomycini]
MYLESIGNPRKFTRLARRTAAAKPLVVVQGARHGAGPGARRTGDPAAPRDGVRAAAAGRGDPRGHHHRTGRHGLCSPASPLPAGGWRSSATPSPWACSPTTACLAEGLRPHRPLDLSTAASAADFHAALSHALADDTSDAVVVTAIRAVGEGPVGDADLARALSSAAAATPSKPVLVVHVELGGLARPCRPRRARRPRRRPAPCRRR